MLRTLNLTILEFRSVYSILTLPWANHTRESQPDIKREGVKNCQCIGWSSGEKYSFRYVKRMLKQALSRILVLDENSVLIPVKFLWTRFYKEACIFNLCLNHDWRRKPTSFDQHCSTQTEKDFLSQKATETVISMLLLLNHC